MTQRVKWEDWQQVRRELRPIQAAVLVQRKGATPSDAPQPLRSHRPRSEEDWAALADAVRGLLQQRFRSGRWLRTGPRRIEVDPARGWDGRSASSSPSVCHSSS